MTTAIGLPCCALTKVVFVRFYVLRQKLHGQTLNLFIVEQLSVIPRDNYTRKFGKKSAADIVKDDVLALTYTANDMEPFARDIGL